MEQFTTRHQDKVIGMVEGFDRVLFRGNLPSISYGQGLGRFLSHIKVPLREFKSFAPTISAQVAEHARNFAKQQNRPYRHLRSPKASKEAIAREIAETDHVQQGLICVLSCVEPCRTFSARWVNAVDGFTMVPQTRQCNFFYFYFLDPEFGLLHVRLQSWFPFPIQVCINGRSYLERQLIREKIGYVKRDNCFCRIDDLDRAQAIMDRLSRRRWGPTLNRIIRGLNPLLGPGAFLGERREYYWTIRQSEVATDVMFRDAAALGEIYPALCDHVSRHFGGEDVLRFFGKKATLNFTDEVITERQRLVEGVRVRHRVYRNSIKMYDKHGCVLRIETTMNNPKPFRVWRKAQGDPHSAPAWRTLRKGIADTTRRVRLSTDANHRYLNALAVVHDPAPISRVLDPVSRPAAKRQRRARALRPIAPDEAAIFQAVLRGQHNLRGFTNRELQAHFFDDAPRDARERARRCSWVTRRLQLLRRHGLIAKVGNRRLYRVTPKGHQVMTVALALRNANVPQFRAA